jgi:hypothetical protein
MNWWGLAKLKIHTTASRATAKIASEWDASSRAVFVFLWKHHSPSKATALAFATAVAILVFCLGVSRITSPWPSVGGIPPSDALPLAISSQQSVSEILGGFVAIWLTILAFVVGFRAERSDDSAATIPYILRRYSAYNVAALVAAVALANLVMPMLVHWVDAGAILLLQRLNLPLVPIVVLLQLYFAYRALADITHPHLEAALPVMEQDMKTLLESKKSDKALSQYFRALSSQLVHHAHAQNTIALADKLDDFTSTYRSWLKLLGNRTAELELFRFSGEPDNIVGPLSVRIYDICKAVGSQNDTRIVQQLFDSLVGWVVDAARAEQMALIEGFLSALRSAISAGCKNRSIAPEIPSITDSAVDSLLWLCPDHSQVLSKYRSQEDELRSQHQRDAEKVVLGWIFGRFLHSMTAGDGQLVGYLYERIFMNSIGDPRDPRFADFAYDGVTPEVIADYMEVLTAGWALKTLRRGTPTGQQAARIVLNHLLGRQRNAKDLVALWELLKESSAENDRIANQELIEARLGVSDLELLELQPLRQRQVRGHFVDETWKFDGLLLLLLFSMEMPDRQYAGYFQSTPSRHLWHPTEVKRQLEGLMELDTVKELMQQRQNSADSSVKLVERRLRSAESAEIEYISKLQIPERSITDLRDRLEVELVKERNYVRWMNVAGLCTVGSAPGQRPLRSSWRLPKSTVVDFEMLQQMVGTVAKDLVAKEVSVLISSIVVAAGTIEPARSLAELPSIIRAAVGRMKSNGLAPSLLVVPREQRFATAILQGPLWELRERDAGPVESYGEWEGLRVIVHPLRGFDRVLIVDVGQALAENQSGEDSRAVEIARPIELTREQVTGSSTLPLDGKRDDYQPMVELLISSYPVVVVSGSQPRLSGIHAISLADTDACYAMWPNDRLYHRPTCRRVKDDDELQYRLHPWLENDTVEREPCPDCSPQIWDFEGRTRAMNPPTS